MRQNIFGESEVAGCKICGGMLLLLIFCQVGLAKRCIPKIS